MRVELNPCYILHQRAYRESSLLLDVFSREQGRVNLVARGVKKSNKENKSAILQPYQLLQLAWSGKGELGTLTKMELESVSLAMTSNTVLYGFYLNELLVRLLHKHEPHQQLFDSYKQALISLQEQFSTEQVLRKFEKKLLEELGYGLSLDYDAETSEPIKPEQEYYYVLHQGPSILYAKNTDSVPIKGASLQALKDEFFDDAIVLRESKRLMRHLLKSLLGPKPLASRELFSQHSYTKSSDSVTEDDKKIK